MTGGKGDLGGRMVPILRKLGYEVLIGSRSPTQPDDVLYTLEGDPTPLLVDVDVVVHLASDPAKPKHDIDSVARLVTACEEAEVQHLVFISIVGIDEHPLPYYQAKLACEEVIAEGDVGWTILRATQFHSFLPTIAELLRRGPVTLVPSGYRIQSIDADSVAERLVELINVGPSGRARDIGGPEIIDVADAIRELPNAGGRGRRVFSVALPGKLGSAFRNGMNLLGEDGEVLGEGYSTYRAAP